MSNLSFKGEFKDGATKITIKVGVYLFREDNVFIAYCPALDMSGYGENENEAKKSFEQSMSIYVEYCIRKNTLVADLKKHGWDIKSKRQRKIKSPDISAMMDKIPEFKDIVENKDYVKYSENIGIPAFV